MGRVYGLKSADGTEFLFNRGRCLNWWCNWKGVRVFTPFGSGAHVRYFLPSYTRIFGDRDDHSASLLKELLLLGMGWE